MRKHILDVADEINKFLIRKALKPVNIGFSAFFGILWEVRHKCSRNTIAFVIGMFFSLSSRLGKNE